MGLDLMKFSDAKARRAKDKVQILRELIEATLMADDDACATAIQDYLAPPGIAGSKEYDHAYAVMTVLEYDKRSTGGKLNDAVTLAKLSHRQLWDHLATVYRRAGFDLRHGRVVGLLENGKDKPAQDAQDSID